MKSGELLLACMISASTSVAIAQTAKDPFSITISADKPTVVAGSRVYIRIKLTNMSDHVVDCSSAMVGAFDRRYLYEVLDENGKSMIKTDIDPERYQFCNLDPGESTGNGERLIRWLYDFTKPGTYTVQLSRFIGNDEKQGAVKSNTITITVIPADNQPPAQP